MGLIHNSHQFLHRLPALASPSRGRDGISGCKHKEGGGKRDQDPPIISAALIFIIFQNLRHLLLEETLSLSLKTRRGCLKDSKLPPKKAESDAAPRSQPEEDDGGGQGEVTGVPGFPAARDAPGTGTSPAARRG